MEIANRVAAIRVIYQQLRQSVEIGIWWPAETRFEIFIGAILTQNTAWRNVEKSLNRLKSRDLGNPAAIVNIPNENLQELIRPSGFMRAKSVNLQKLAQWFLDRDLLAQQLATENLREELLAQAGVGQETADALLLYAYRRRVFIYDSYARRMFSASGLGSFKSYGAARKSLNHAIMAANFTHQELAEFHALIVEAGKLAQQRGTWSLDLSFDI